MKIGFIVTIPNASINPTHLNLIFFIYIATRKMVAEQVEKNISRPNEYRVNILNGVIKVLTENHEHENRVYSDNP